MITTAERNQIRQLLTDPKWATAEALANEIIRDLQAQSTVKDSEYETLRATIERDGMVKGIQHFTQELWKHAKHEQA